MPEYASVLILENSVIILKETGRWFLSLQPPPPPPGGKLPLLWVQLFAYHLLFIISEPVSSHLKPFSDMESVAQLAMKTEFNTSSERYKTLEECSNRGHSVSLFGHL